MKQCCCGCSLRVGTLAIGYFFAITGFVGTVVCFALMEEFKNGPTKGSPPEYQVVIIALAVGGTVGLVQLLVSVPLIYGVYLGKKEFLAAWKVYAWICYGFALVTVFLAVIELAVSHGLLSLVQIIVFAICACLQWYALAVVRSYCKFLTVQNDIQLAILLANEIDA